MQMRQTLLIAGALACVTPLPARAMTCTFGTVSSPAFGVYHVVATSPLDTTGSITYTCTGLVAAVVTIDLSTGSGSSYSARTMKNGAASLGYNLYTDAGHHNVWGDGTGSTDHYGPVLVVLGAQQTLTVYGEVPALQHAKVGSYTDTIIVTINY
jgi:spore coat protein U-like protein